MKVLYTADVTAEGARHGHVRSSDGLLDHDLALPPGMGGRGDKTNPEQLFGAGYAACFGGAVEYQAALAKKKTGVVTVRAQVGVGPFGIFPVQRRPSLYPYRSIHQMTQFSRGLTRRCYSLQ